MKETNITVLMVEPGKNPTLTTIKRQVSAANLAPKKKNLYVFFTRNEVPTYFIKHK